MKLFLKLVGLVLVLAVVLVIGAAVYVVQFFDPNDYKDQIAARVQQQTGRELAMNGPIGFEIYPWLGLRLEDVTLGNAPGFGDDPLFHVDLMQVRVKLMPLLRERIEMDRIQVHGLALNLAVDESGRSNWADLAKGETEEGGPPPGVGALAIGGVDVRDAAIRFRDIATGETFSITRLDAQTGELVAGEPLTLALSFDAASSKPALAGDVQLDGTVSYDEGYSRLVLEPFAVVARFSGPNVPGGQATSELSARVEADLDASTLSITGLQLAALDTRITGRLDARRVHSDAPAATGTLAIEGKDLTPLLRVAEMTALAEDVGRLPDPSFTARLDLDADLQDGRLSVPELSAELLGASISGHLEASRVQSEEPAVEGRLEASGPDLPLLMRLAGQFQAGEDKPLLEMGRQLAGSGERAFTLSTRFDADLAAGRVDLPELSAELLGARVGGRLAADRVQSEQPALEGRLEASGPDLPLLMRLAGGFQAGADKPLLAMGRQLAGSANRAFTLSTRFDADLASGRVDLPELKIATLGLQVNGDLKADDVNDPREPIAGRLTVDGEGIGPLLAALEQPGLAEVLQSVRLETGVAGTMANLVLKPLALAATFAGEDIPSSPVTLTASADASANLDKGRASLKNLAVSGLGLDVKGSLEATGIQSEPAFQGDLAVSPFNLRRLLESLQQDLPEMADPNTLQRVALNTTFSGTADSIEISKLSAVLDQSNIQGELAVNDFADPAVRFGLGIDAINADRYLPPPDAEAQAPPPSPEAAAAGAATLPLETLRALKLEGDLLIGSLTISGARMTDVKISVNARDGDIAVDPIAANLYGGSYRGRIGLDARGEQPVLDIESQLQGVNADPLLGDVTGTALVAGTAGFNADLTAVGGDADRIKRTLAGTARFNVQDGVYRGLDVRKVLYQVETMIERKRPSRIDRSGETRFDQLSGSFVIEEGIVRNNDLTLRAPGIKVTGQGMLCDLPADQIDYDVQLAVDETTVENPQDRINLGGYSVPAKCRGSCGSPNCLPDTARIVENLIRDEAGEKIRDFLGKQLGVERDTGRQAPAQQQQQQQQQQTEQKDPEDALKEQLLKGLFGN